MKPDAKFERVSQTKCVSGNQDLLWWMKKAEWDSDGKQKPTIVCHRDKYCFNLQDLSRGFFPRKADIGR